VLPNKRLHPTGAGVSWAPEGEPQRWAVRTKSTTSAA
jgi:hypothetical protein